MTKKAKDQPPVPEAAPNSDFPLPTTRDRGIYIEDLDIPEALATKMKELAPNPHYYGDSNLYVALESKALTLEERKQIGNALLTVAHDRLQEESEDFDKAIATTDYTQLVDIVAGHPRFYFNGYNSSHALHNVLRTLVEGLPFKEQAELTQLISEGAVVGAAFDQFHKLGNLHREELRRAYNGDSLSIDVVSNNPKLAGAAAEFIGYTLEQALSQGEVMVSRSGSGTSHIEFAGNLEDARARLLEQSKTVWRADVDARHYSNHGLYIRPDPGKDVTENNVFGSGRYGYTKDNFFTVKAASLVPLISGVEPAKA